MNTRWLLEGGPFALASRLGRLQDEFNRAFAPRFGLGAGSFPLINSWVEGDEVLVEAEVPGVDLKDIDVSVTDEFLTLKGERREEAVDDAVCHRRERWHGSFSRTLELPFRVDAEKVSAVCKNGVLRVRLPRSEQDKAKKVKVASE